MHVFTTFLYDEFIKSIEMLYFIFIILLILIRIFNLVYFNTNILLLFYIRTPTLLSAIELLSITNSFLILIHICPQVDIFLEFFNLQFKRSLPYFILQLLLIIDMSSLSLFVLPMKITDN